MSMANQMYKRYMVKDQNSQLVVSARKPNHGGLKVWRSPYLFMVDEAFKAELSKNLERQGYTNIVIVLALRW